MDSLAIAFGLAGIIGAAISTWLAILPDVRDWYFDRWKNQPLRVEVLRTLLRVSPARGGRIQIRIWNRIRTAVSVQFSPMTKEECYTDGEGKLQTRGVLVEGPYLRLYPDGQPSGFFWLGGRDSREAEIVFPIRPGMLRGAEDIVPRIFANRFRAQEICLGPFHLDVDPMHM